MATTYWQKLRLLNRDVRLYLVTAVLIGLVYMGIYAVLLNLYLLRLDFGPQFIGGVNAAVWVTFALFSMPAGALGARPSVRRTMIGGMMLVVAGYGLFPLGEFLPPTWQRAWLLATMALVGLGTSSYMVNGSPFLMGAAGPAEQDHAFSVQSALWPLAGFAGSLAGGVLPGLFAGALGVPLDGPTPLASIVRPAFMVYSQRLVTPTWQPLMSGATNLAAGLGSGAIALAGGYAVVALGGYRSFFLLPAGLIAAGAVLFGAYFRVPRGELREAGT